MKQDNTKQRLTEVMSRLNKDFKITEGWETATNDAGEPMGTEYYNDSLDNDMYDDNMEDNQPDRRVNNSNEVDWDGFYDILVNNAKVFHTKQGEPNYTVNALINDNIISQHMFDVLEMMNLDPNWGVDFDMESGYPFFDVKSLEDIPQLQTFIAVSKNVLEKY